VFESEDAAALYRRALKQAPESLRMQLSLTMANVKAGHYATARESLELALKVHPGTPEIINTLARILAMALAETGDFKQAAALQRETIFVSEHTVGESEKSFLQKNLARYEQRKASREGWAADDPVFQPRGPAAQLIKAPHAL
jgi:tetratricopeptide (TPR) repeat protein